jgi:D-arabinose 1-dehydrogenase-like Zn-dependent alcohol dehydrogenase
LQSPPKNRLYPLPDLPLAHAAFYYAAGITTVRPLTGGGAAGEDVLTVGFGLVLEVGMAVLDEEGAA